MLSGFAVWVKGFEQTSRHRIRDDAGRGRVVRFGNAQPPAQGLVGHAFARYLFEAGVLVAGPDFILPVCFPERKRAEQHHVSKLLGDLEAGRGQVVLLAFLHDFVDAAAALLTHIQLAHSHSEQFIATTRGVVDEAALVNQGLARISGFDAVLEHVNLRRNALGQKILVN